MPHGPAIQAAYVNEDTDTAGAEADLPLGELNWYQRNVLALRIGGR